MQRRLLKYLLLLFFSFYSFTVYSDVLLDKLVTDLDQWLKAKEKIRIDFSESKYTRNKLKEKKLEGYMSSVFSLRVLIAQMFLADLWGNNPKNVYGFMGSPSIEVKQFYASLKAFKEAGGVFKTGDIIFFRTSSPMSSQIARMIHSNYSHAGMLWLKENKDIYLVDVDPEKDLQIVKLYDYITAFHPKLTNMGVYRSVKDFDEKEASYILKDLEDNQDSIMFDPFFVNNPGIKIPEKYFKQYPYFYCTELIYLFYAYLFKTKDFITHEHLSSKTMIKNFTSTTAQVDSFLDAIDDFNDKNKQYFIHPNNFIHSNIFKQVYVIKAEPKNE